RLRDHVQREGRLARGFRPEDLDHAPARHAADAEGGVERERAGGNGGHVHLVAGAQPHDRPLAELLVDLRQGRVDRLCPLLVVYSHEPSPFPFPPPVSSPDVDGDEWMLAIASVAAGPVGARVHDERSWSVARGLYRTSTVPGSCPRNVPTMIHPGSDRFVISDRERCDWISNTIDA